MKKTDFIPLKESGNLTSALEGIIQSLRLIEGFTKNLLPESLITEGLRSALKELRQEINLSGKTWMNYSTSSGFFDTLTLISDIYIYRLILELLEIGTSHLLSRNVFFNLRRVNDKLFLTVNYITRFKDNKLAIGKASQVLERMTELIRTSGGIVTQLRSEENRYEYLIFFQLSELSFEK
jgi:hypothetical protein